MQTYFEQYNHFHSLFITPKTNPATLKLIDDLLQKASELIDDDSITIGVITNDQFFEDIIVFEILHLPFPLARIFFPILLFASKISISIFLFNLFAVIAAIIPEAPPPIIAIFKIFL